MPYILKELLCFLFFQETLNVTISLKYFTDSTVGEDGPNFSRGNI